MHVKCEKAEKAEFSSETTSPWINAVVHVRGMLQLQVLLEWEEAFSFLYLCSVEQVADTFLIRTWNKLFLGLSEISYQLLHSFTCTFSNKRYLFELFFKVLTVNNYIHVSIPEVGKLRHIWNLEVSCSEFQVFSQQATNLKVRHGKNELPLGLLLP